jgi:CRP-like cAMP-binding protein
MQATDRTGFPGGLTHPMKTFIVVPTYWSRETGVGWQEGDAIYDHPTPLDQDGTLAKTLESLRILEDSDYTLAVLACASAPDLESAVEAKVHAITEAMDPPVETYVISHSHLHAIQDLLKHAGREDLINVLSLVGYSNIRNMCLFIPLVLGAEVVVLIDDDELIDEPTFLSRAREFIGSRFMGQTIDGVAGYYLNEKGTYYDDVPEEIHWMTYWDRFGSKREAFDKIIPGEPRLKLTPFAFGGCMVLHRSLFRSVPFDPCITRGEDTDYVLNARMFGFNFFLDNQLYIQHRPPKKMHPTWQRFREDIFRLLYSKAKIEGQTQQVNMTIVEPEDFDPYPGEFLRDTLGDKILKTNLILALDYLTQDRVEDAKETIRNIWLAKTIAIPKDNPFEVYLDFQRRWRSLRKLVKKELNGQMTDILQEGKVLKEVDELKMRAMRAEFEGRSEEDLLPSIEQCELFRGLRRDQVQTLLESSELKFFAKDEVLIEAGSTEHDLFVILRGKARITVASHNDEPTELVEIGVGEVLGEISLLIDAPHSATVTAVEPMEALKFTRLSLAAIMAVKPDLAAKLWHRLAQSLGNRLRDTNMRYITQVREIQDVSDEMLGTQPLSDQDEGDEM